MTAIIHGRKFIEILMEHDIIPENCTHVIIEASADNVVNIHYHVFGEERLLEVLPEAVQAATVQPIKPEEEEHA